MVPVIAYSYIARSSIAAEGIKPDVFGQYQPDVKPGTFHSTWSTKYCKMLAAYKTEPIQTMDKPAKVVPHCQVGCGFEATDIISRKV